MNRASTSDEIQVFVEVVDRGSFAAAAEETGLTPSGVSKTITRLEDRLGVRLLERTTRRLVLTPEGETLLNRGREILAAIEAAEAEVTAARGKPRGLIRVNTGTAYAKHKLAPLLPAFHEKFPEIQVELGIADRRIDVIGEQVDIAIRTGPLGDTSMIARKIGEAHRIICASPTYIARHGAPKTAADLARHNCLILSGQARVAEWPMRVDDRVVPIAVKGSAACDNAEILVEMALAGLGLVRLGSFLMEEALADGRLVSLMTDVHVSEPMPISAIMPPGRQNLPRVRAFLDFLTHPPRETAR